MKIKEVFKIYFAPFIFALAFFAIMFIALFVYVDSHETIHQMIYKDYGIDSYIIYSINPFNDWMGKTIPYNQTLAQQNCNDTCKFAHEMNEIIGYNTEILICLSFVFVAFHYGYHIWRHKHYD